ncbi:MAG: hypothetical protein ABI333_23660 [bacterium]
MFRAIKILGWILAILLLLLVGAAVALFFSENSQWVPVSWPYPQLSFDEPFAVHTFEVVLGVAAAGWIFAILLICAALVLFPLYLRRTRQYTASIKKLEKELVDLRNLPLKSPAPLEDLPDEQVKDDELSEDDLERDLLREEESAPA